MRTFTLAVILGNRDFFPDILVSEARRDLLAACARLGIETILLEESHGKFGSVETWIDAQACADLFRRHRDTIDGILVCLPNFGDEKGVADTIRLSELRAPVLVQACPDDLDMFGLERRRDAFCGKISVCNNLRQYGIPFSLTFDHVVGLNDPQFLDELRRFERICRTTRGLRRARIGAVGARPNAFKTTRYSEKIFESAGISVSTIDLSDIFAMVDALPASDPPVAQRLDTIRDYADTAAVPPDALSRMARFAVVLDRWMHDEGLQSSAVQCWTSMQKTLGVNACTAMSMMSENMMPSACEVDVAGAVSMYALQLASGRPSALVDWNNNYGRQPDKCVLFHCGNWPKEFLPNPRIATAPILGTVVGEQNTYGALAGRTPAGPLTYGRVSTDDSAGTLRAYAGEGEFLDDPLATFGTSAVVHVPRLRELMHFVCRHLFEHHAAMNGSHCAAVFAEVAETYLGWPTYLHR
ncbi:MAG: L-fucose/L-arabinose isomerase family protein [Acidobacteriota bacterium]